METELAGVGQGNSPRSHRLTPEQLAKGRLKSLEVRRAKAKRIEEEISSGSVGSKWRLMEGQEALADIAKGRRREFKRQARVYERAAKAVGRQNGLVVSLELAAEKERWSWEQKTERILPEREKLKSLREDAERQFQLYRDAERELRDVLKEMGRFAEAAAPYFDPKLAATDVKVTANTQVSGKVTHEHRADELLEVCAESIRVLVGGGLGVAPRRIRADGPQEPLDPAQALPEAADVPHVDGP